MQIKSPVRGWLKKKMRKRLERKSNNAEGDGKKKHLEKHLPTCVLTNVLYGATAITNRDHGAFKAFKWTG